jgi:hypothetical protein
MTRRRQRRQLQVVRGVLLLGVQQLLLRGDVARLLVVVLLLLLLLLVLVLQLVLLLVLLLGWRRVEHGRHKVAAAWRGRG